MEEDELIFVVTPEEQGQRADKYLSVVCADLSRARLQKLIEDGHIQRNGAVLDSASLKTQAGDEFIVIVPPPVDCVPKPEAIPLDIVYEDDDLLVINKAAGMVVHPGAGNWSGTLVNALLAHCAQSLSGNSLSGIGGVIRPGIVHRLDKDTSGLMIVAKNDYAHQFLAAQLADRSLSRVYMALVFGVPLPLKGVVSRPIGRHKHHRQKMSVVGEHPRDATTHYRVLENFGEACALVECVLETGRTHQIRVHMEAIGHPILGDPLYGVQPTALISRLKKCGYSAENIEKILSFGRQCLHARAITFVHPETEEDMDFERAAPQDFEDILKILRK